MNYVRTQKITDRIMYTKARQIVSCAAITLKESEH